jgi:hypothetical protein
MFKVDEKSLIPVILNCWVDIVVHSEEPYDGTQLFVIGTKSVGTCIVI